jgi:hypothetical protein
MKPELPRHSLLPAAAIAGACMGLLLAACSGGATKLAPATSTPFPTPAATLSIPGSDGQPVQGVQCLATEQLAYHIHAHLTLLVDGDPVLVPAGIGIAPPRETQQGFVTGGKCFYWLHTHDVSGIIHIESPTAQIYTLGQFFAVWGQPLSATQVATFQIDSAKPLRAFVNGQAFDGPPEQIPLNAHTLVTLEVGRQVAPPSFSFPPGL